VSEFPSNEVVILTVARPDLPSIMANLVRSAKSGSDWTSHELRSYNIRVVEQSFREFFLVAELPPASEAVRPFLETLDRAAAKEANDRDTYKLIHHLDLAHEPKMGQEAAADSFAEKLLDKLGYASGFRIILTRQSFPFTICGINSSAQTDVCICDEKDILLLVQEDKCLENPADPEPQLIAEAIAAYQCNNLTRERDLYLPRLDEMVFPAITLVGTFPTFYKIKITAGLNDAVVSGTFPGIETVVFRHIPRLPRRKSEGMKPLDNRSVIVRYFEAFRQFV
jgi:hypothetical protein